MSKTLQWLLFLILVSCTTPSHEREKMNADPEESAMPVAASAVSSTTPMLCTSEMESSYGEETATFYIVIADTGSSYQQLHSKMFAMNGVFKIPIDTMGRSYDAAKDLIALPEDDEDEVFAGDYYPRRFPSQTLSLEYLSLYQQKATEKTMALVAGIYESRNTADSALTVLEQFDKKAFMVETDMYIGCIH
ncbi:hypothetical protein OB13_15415 [Pontibacter sp. HJ8]